MILHRREQKRRDRDAVEAKERARAAELQRKRDLQIERIEAEWLVRQEQQRSQDDAMVQFIRTARERRAAEREMVRAVLVCSSPGCLSHNMRVSFVQEKREMEEKAMLEEKLKRWARPQHLDKRHLVPTPRHPLEAWLCDSC